MGTHDGASARSADEQCDWVAAHEALSRLSRKRAALDAEEGRWLLRAWRSAAHVHLGYGSFAQYIESLFGYKPRTTQEKLRVAEALESLPHLARALESGALSWCAARELTRVALPDTERAWLDAARGKTLREIEMLVASKAHGDTPDAPASKVPRSRVLRFEVAPDTYATFREAVLSLQRSAGGGLDDDALLLAMARHVLGGPRDEGRSSYQLSLNVCAVCSGGTQAAAGELVPVDAAVVDMATCDAQHLGELVPLSVAPRAGTPRAANENAIPLADAEGGVHDAPATSSGDEHTATRQRLNNAHVDAPTPRVNAAAAERPSGATDTTLPKPTDDTPPTYPGPAGTDTTLPKPTASTDTTLPKPTAASDTTLPKSAAGSDARPRPRAKQSIPPALRRAVLARDQHRCRAPGCTHATFIDVHHVQPRSEGGANEASNLLTLCGAHHRATHRGELLIELRHDGAFVFRHADGSVYGHPIAPRLIDAHAKVFSALRHLGFREGEVKTVLSELRGDAELDGATVERLLREALCRIRLRPR